MRRGNKEMFEEIAFFGIRADDALAAAALLAIGIQIHPLDIAAMAHRYENAFVGDQVLDVKVLDVAGYFCSPLVAVFFFYLVNILADDIHEQLIVGQNSLVVGDLVGQFGIFLCELFNFKAGEPLELHCQDRIGLRAGEELVGF